MDNKISHNSILAFGLPKKDLYFTLLIVVFFGVCFYFIFNQDYSRVTYSIRALSPHTFLIFQIALLSALTLGCYYAYQLTKNTSFFYLTLSWFAHAMYKIFTIGFVQPKFENGRIQDSVINGYTVSGEDIGYQFILMAIIALVADVPLFLSSFPYKKRSWWLPFLPMATLVLMVILSNINLDIISKVKFVFLIGPAQSFLILIWLSYSTVFRNLFSISKRLSVFLAITFIALAISQIPFIYEARCFPCEENENIHTFWRFFTLGIFSSFLTILFFIVKDELRGFRSVEEQLKVKGEFEDLGYLAASIEHEIRNPLEGIKGDISELNRTLQHMDGFQSKIDSLEIQVYRLSLAANIIKILRLKKEAFAKTLKETLVFDRIKSATKYFKKEFPLWSGKMSIRENENTKELFILAFPAYLEQIFVNLLKNSFEATERKGKRGEVVIDLYLVNKETVGITFSDTNGGFILEDIPNLTKPDYTKKEISRSESNRGLGLFVCAKVVELHGGKLEFSNNTGGGADVKLEFPRYFTKRMLKDQEVK